MQLTFWLTSLFDDDWNRGAYATEFFEIYALHSTDFFKQKPDILLTSVRLIRLVMIEHKPSIYTLKMHMYIHTKWALFLSILLRISLGPLLVGFVMVDNKSFMYIPRNAYIYTLKMGSFSVYIAQNITQTSEGFIVVIENYMSIRNFKKKKNTQLHVNI